VSFPFLSEPWVEAVRAIRDEYAERAMAELPTDGDDVAVNLLITDVPDRPDGVRAHAAVRAGASDLDLGHEPDAAVLVTVDYDTARKAVVEQDLGAVVRGFLLGKIAIQGDLTKLLGPDGSDPAALLAAFDITGSSTVGDIDPLAGEIADRIRGVTA
jgi:hypothetical protein